MARFKAQAFITGFSYVRVFCCVVRWVGRAVSERLLDRTSAKVDLNDSHERIVVGFKYNMRNEFMERRGIVKYRGAKEGAWLRGLM